MSYCKLQDTCYTQCNKTITNNKKYIDPFFKDAETVKSYNLNTQQLNSYSYNENNLYPNSKSYNTIAPSYTHFLKNIIKNKEKQLLEAKESPL